MYCVFYYFDSYLDLCVCVCRAVHQVMRSSKCGRRKGRMLRLSAATSAAWRNAMWRYSPAQHRRWTWCWWVARFHGAAFRRHHVSYDVSANGLRGCFSQLRVGGASHLPLPPVLAPFLPLTQRSMAPEGDRKWIQARVKSSGWMFLFVMICGDWFHVHSFSSCGGWGSNLGLIWDYYLIKSLICEWILWLRFSCFENLVWHSVRMMHNVSSTRCDTDKTCEVTVWMFWCSIDISNPSFWSRLEYQVAHLPDPKIPNNKHSQDLQKPDHLKSLTDTS